MSDKLINNRNVSWYIFQLNSHYSSAYNLDDRFYQTKFVEWIHPLVLKVPLVTLTSLEVSESTFHSVYFVSKQTSLYSTFVERARIAGFSTGREHLSPRGGMVTPAGLGLGITLISRIGTITWNHHHHSIREILTICSLPSDPSRASVAQRLKCRTRGRKAPDSKLAWAICFFT